ncbi:hypothetical protein J1N35_042025 [Gossypium stocksii]|uniref:Vacuolar iron transporter n=1 Tax=Gossypium stocksii TaxID=47602 RepID=A0A9D3UGU0_9ROSI|nr:hypothetical protein J1N35_042025 [Gossypium stocksii]
MAASQSLQLSSLNNVETPIHIIDTEENQIQDPAVDVLDYSQRGQWLRAAVLGANDGLVSVASLMMGVASLKEDVKAVVVSGFAGLVAGACSMAIREFVSVGTQRDVEIAQMKREKRQGSSKRDENDEKLQSPKVRMAVASMALVVFGVLKSKGACWWMDMV